jgi:hypothetical protein
MQQRMITSVRLENPFRVVVLFMQSTSSENTDERESVLEN